MKTLTNMCEINQASELIELIANNYTVEARMSICATIIETVAEETGMPIGQVYDTMKQVAEILYNEI